MKRQWMVCILLVFALMPCLASSPTREGAETWLQDAQNLAQYNLDNPEDELVPLYVGESTLHQMIALAHTVLYARESGNTAVFVYSDKIKPDISVFPDLDIHFLESNPPHIPDDKKWVLFTPYLQEKISQIIGDKDFILYATDRAFWMRHIRETLGYAAHAKEIHLIEGGGISYDVVGVRKGLDWLEKNSTAIEEYEDLFQVIREDYPLNQSNSFVDLGRDEAPGGKLLKTFDKRGYTLYSTLLPIYKQDNVFHWWQHPQGAPTLDSPRRLNLRELFNALSPADQDAFLRFFRYDRESFVEKYWAKSPKKNMVVVGPGAGKSASDVRRWVFTLRDLYGEEYDLIYKPHPRLHQRDLELFANEEGITVFQEIFPFELIEITGAADSYASGFSSILYFIDDISMLDHIISFGPRGDRAWIQGWPLFQEIMGIPDETILTLEELIEREEGKD